MPPLATKCGDSTRFPGPGEPGHETWSGDSWKRGGGSIWVTGSYDPELNLTYWGVGNPAPDWNGDVRLGDNLYSDSVVALNADTGKLEWYFQFTPHDEWDWDSVQIPVLVDREWKGEQRKLMLWANRNGFFYVLDRTTGEFLHGKNFVKVTWAEGLDENGRPIKIPEASPTREGVRVWPAVQGGTNWYSPAYSARTDLFYVSSWEYSSLFHKGDPLYVRGNPLRGQRAPRHLAEHNAGQRGAAGQRGYPRALPGHRGPRVGVQALWRRRVRNPLDRWGHSRDRHDAGLHGRAGFVHRQEPADAEPRRQDGRLTDHLHCPRRAVHRPERGLVDVLSSGWVSRQRAASRTHPAPALRLLARVRTLCFRSARYPRRPTRPALRWPNDTRFG